MESSHLDSESHELTKISDYFYSKDDTKYHKPDPRVFDEILSESSFKPEQCVYIGDSLSDCVAAKLTGLKFIACLESGLRSREDFEKLDYKPDVYIARFSDLEKVEVLRGGRVKLKLREGLSLSSFGINLAGFD